MEHTPAVLIPELNVSDIGLSLPIYLDVFGFSILYDRPEEKFAYLAHGKAELMLEEVSSLVRSFHSALLERPFGRGVNFQIFVPDSAALYENALNAGLQIIIPLEDKWYRKDRSEVGNRQFVVADPDGYLLRFASDLGERPL